ncbi:hypothetical protein COOONC_21293 [Cooperia oncophora]
MLATVERSCLLSFCRSPIMPHSKRMFADRISDAYRAVRKQPQAALKEGGGYATKISYDQQMKTQRIHGADAESGVIPTKWQKLCLVITRLYNRPSDIPQYIS